MTLVPFQLLGITTLPSRPWGRGVDVLILWGRTRAGKLVAAQSYGFRPYCVIKKTVPADDLRRTIQDLYEDQVEERHGELPFWFKPLALTITEEQGRSIRDTTVASLASPDVTFPFLKLTVQNTQQLRVLKTILRSNAFASSHGATTCYESNIGADLRWMLDRNLKPCYWLRATEVLPDVKPMYQHKTRCRVLSTAVSYAAMDTGYACAWDDDVAPLTVAVLDIETLPFEMRKEERIADPSLTPVIDFRGAQLDPILQISLCVAKSTALTQVTYVLFLVEDQPTATMPTTHDDGTFTPSACRLVSCRTEAEMLTRFCEVLCDMDPDIITGYNVLNFDMKYIWDRCEVLRIKPVALRWSRLQAYTCRMREKRTKTRAFGEVITWVFDIPGRIVLDMYQFIKKAHKLSSYKLDNVAKTFLGSQKMDVAYNQIPKLQETSQGRMTMGAYCLKDSWLVLQLMDRLCTIPNLVEMSRVCGITMHDVLNRGQMIRSLTNIYYYAKRHVPRYFIPEHYEKKRFEKQRMNRFAKGQELRMEVDVTATEVEAGGYKGAVVIDPTPGYYTDPVTCLDFASLYPSIMRYKNMCYSTLVSLETIRRLAYVEDVDYHRIAGCDIVDGAMVVKRMETDVCFLTTRRRPGVLPQILDTLLAARKRAKKDMKAAKDKHTYNVCNGRQLALKVVCNSLYGFTGTTYGFLPEKRIASSVTSTGRFLALSTKAFCEKHYPGTTCVYGDTDSVFMKVPRTSSWLQDCRTTRDVVHAVAKLSEEMAAACDAHYHMNDQGYINLEFEKVLYPFVLLKKKRYFSYKYEEGKLDKPKVDFKGIELTRRDGCTLTKQWMGDILPMVLQEQNLDKVRTYITTHLRRLLMQEVPLEQFVMSKQLAKHPDNYKNKPEHVVLAEKLMSNPKYRIGVGDRIAYVIRRGFKGEKVRSRAVLPEDIEAGTHALDIDYYVEKKIVVPLTSLLTYVLPDIRDLFRCHARKSTLGTGMEKLFGKGHVRRRAPGVVAGRPRKKHKVMRKSTQRRITAMLKA